MSVAQAASRSSTRMRPRRPASSGLAAVVSTMRAWGLDSGMGTVYEDRFIRWPAFLPCRQQVHIRSWNYARFKRRKTGNLPSRAKCCSMYLAVRRGGRTEKDDEHSDQVWHLRLEGHCGRRVYCGQHSAGGGGHCRLREDPTAAAPC